MFDDLGSRENLPLLTQWATSPWGPIALAIPTGVALAFGIGASAPMRRRRAWIVGAVLLGCASCALCLVGLYLPIFVLARAIESRLISDELRVLQDALATGCIRAAGVLAVFRGLGPAGGLSELCA
jgi:hypothetical protein